MAALLALTMQVRSMHFFYASRNFENRAGLLLTLVDWTGIHLHPRRDFYDPLRLMAGVAECFWQFPW
jgi:hypothetical protein